MYPRMNRHTRSALVILLGFVSIAFAFRLVGAGSLTPSALPAGTMNTITEVYDALVGSGSFDSTAVTASANGNALEISKCIIDMVNGGPGCP
jgi:hypothetical protein